MRTANTNQLPTGYVAAAGGTVAMGPRVGIFGWWLNLTAPPRPPATAPIAERERIRKAELTSASILAVFLFLVALVSNSLSDPSTGEAVALMFITLLITASLNRFGLTRGAAYLMPSVLTLLIILAVVQAKGGLRLVWLPAYDLLVLPIVISSLIADLWAPWLFASVAIAFIVGDFSLQPHAQITGLGAAHFDDINYEIGVFNIWGMVNRHVLLNLFAAFFSWLGALSVSRAIRRADRAEELVEYERRELEQKRQIEIGAQHLLEVHTRAANGDFSTRVTALGQSNILWQVGQSLNNLLSRIQRQAQAEYHLRRTEAELQRLMDALDALGSNRRPLWPQPTNTAVDPIIRRLVQLTQSGGAPRLGGGSSQQGHVPYGSGLGQGSAGLPPGGSGAGAGAPGAGPLPGTFGYGPAASPQQQQQQPYGQSQFDAWPSLQPENSGPSFPPGAAPYQWPAPAPDQRQDRYGDAPRQQGGYADNNPWFINPDE